MPDIQLTALIDLNYVSEKFGYGGSPAPTPGKIPAEAFSPIIKSAVAWFLENNFEVKKSGLIKAGGMISIECSQEAALAFQRAVAEKQIEGLSQVHLETDQQIKIFPAEEGNAAPPKKGFAQTLLTAQMRGLLYRSTPGGN